MINCSYVDSVLELVELQGMRNSIVGAGVGAGGGADAGLSLEQVGGDGSCSLFAGAKAQPAAEARSPSMDCSYAWLACAGQPMLLS